MPIGVTRQQVSLSTRAPHNSNQAVIRDAPREAGQARNYGRPGTSLARHRTMASSPITSPSVDFANPTGAGIIPAKPIS